MRPLDEKETTAIFEKLFKFTGPNLKHIVEWLATEGPNEAPGRYCFRLHKNRIYYDESIIHHATNISRDHVISVGTYIKKYTNSNFFRLTIQSLNLLVTHTHHKVLLKPTTELFFLYGNALLKGGLARITDNTHDIDGDVVYSMSDVPLGFGVTVRSTQDCRKANANAIILNHQADVGEYLRNEEEL